MSAVPITLQGANQLRQELERLKKVERPRISQAIAEARAHGDLRENSEYKAAREEQSFCEGRIGEIENALANATIIDVTKLQKSNRIVFGVKVTIQHHVNKKIVTYRIVGADEARLGEGLISVHSPIARALIGKECGDTVTVKTPNGDEQYAILDVDYTS